MFCAKASILPNSLAVVELEANPCVVEPTEVEAEVVEEEDDDDEDEEDEAND